MTCSPHAIPLIPRNDSCYKYMAFESDSTCFSSRFSYADNESKCGATVSEQYYPQAQITMKDNIICDEHFSNKQLRNSQAKATE